MADNEPATEEHRVTGDGLVARVKELIDEGNAKRIIIKNDQGHTLIEIPLAMGVIGAVLLPMFVALGAMAALASNYTVVVEKRGDRDDTPKPEVKPM